MAENSPAIAASATPSLTTTTMATTTYYILTVLYYIYIVLRTFYKKAESAAAPVYSTSRICRAAARCHSLVCREPSFSIYCYTSIVGMYICTAAAVVYKYTSIVRGGESYFPTWMSSVDVHYYPCSRCAVSTHCNAPRPSVRRPPYYYSVHGLEKVE